MYTLCTPCQHCQCTEMKEKYFSHRSVTRKLRHPHKSLKILYLLCHAWEGQVQSLKSHLLALSAGGEDCERHPHQRRERVEGELDLHPGNGLDQQHLKLPAQVGLVSTLKGSLLSNIPDCAPFEGKITYI